MCQYNQADSLRYLVRASDRTFSTMASGTRTQRVAYAERRHPPVMPTSRAGPGRRRPTPRYSITQP
jgi:hypothetical protein